MRERNECIEADESKYVVCAVVVFVLGNQRNELSFSSFLSLFYTQRDNLDFNFVLDREIMASMPTTETISPGNIELEEKKEDGLAVTTKDKKRTVSSYQAFVFFTSMFFSFSVSEVL